MLFVLLIREATADDCVTHTQLAAARPQKSVVFNVWLYVLGLLCVRGLQVGDQGAMNSQSADTRLSLPPEFTAAHVFFRFRLRAL